MTFFKILQSRRLLAVSSVFLIIINSMRVCEAWAAPAQCQASAEYISDIKKYSPSNWLEQDYSCLTDYPSLSKKIKHYQLVDIRSRSDFKIDRAWVMSVDELKRKVFLKKRSLLLLGSGFSRVDLASDCALLKKSGFTNVKMLVGGAPQWRQASHSSPPSVAIHFVSASDVISEYFNGYISIISASTNISQQLKKMGITKFNTLIDNQFSAVSDIVLTTSNNGYYPVVYIGDSQSHLDTHNQHALQNLYQLRGGVDGLISQLNIDVLVEASREAPSRAPYCAK